MVVGEGFEPSKASPTDLQSVPFDRSGTPPNHVHSDVIDIQALLGRRNILVDFEKSMQKSVETFRRSSLM